MKKRTFFICIFIIFISCSIIFLNAYDDTDIYKAMLTSWNFSDEFQNGNTPLSLKNFELLNEREKKAYINICNNIKVHPKYIRIPELSNKEFNNVFFSVKNDNPDILCFSDSCNMISFMNMSFLQMEYIHDTVTCDNMMTELNEITDSVISEMKAETQFDKELYIHDYIVENCIYGEAINSSNAYGCLIDRKAVCSGYSRAAMLLLLKAGIESNVISGTGITANDEKISHMWNVVWIDNEPYHLDVTWDDPVSESDDFVSHLFFNLTNKQISVDHIDLSFNIQSENISYNYFIKQNLLFYDFDKNTANIIAEKLYENILNNKNYIEFMFFDEKSYSSAVDKLINTELMSDEFYIIISHLSEKAGNMIDVSHVSFSKDDSRHYLRIMFDKI